ARPAARPAARSARAALTPPPPPGVQPLLGAKDRRRAVHPAERRADVRPRVRGRLQALGQDRAQPHQPLREPLLAATRSRLPATKASRSTSFNPEASSGGRPSSVNAERTAAQ